MWSLDRVAHRNAWRSHSLAEKMCLALGGMGVVLACPGVVSLGLCVGVLGSAAIFGARIPWRMFMRTVCVPAGFVLTGSLTFLFSLDGAGLHWQSAGLQLALPVLMRSLGASVCLCFIALTTPACDLVAGMRWLGVPRDIREMALLMYRFVFQVADTAHTMHLAQAARLGHQGAAARMRALGVLLANLLPRAFERARHTEVGLAARNWQGDFTVLAPRPHFSRLPLCGIVAMWSGVGVLARVMA